MDAVNAKSADEEMDECLKLSERERMRGSSIRHNLIFLTGPPGSGKSTVAHYLQRKYRIVPIHIGDAIRSQKSFNADKSYIEYISPREVCNIILAEIVLYEKRMSGILSFSLDGFPICPQDLTFWMRMHGKEFNVIAVLQFECTANVSLKHCSTRNRPDDTVARVLNRCRTYCSHAERLALLFKSNDLPVYVVENNEDKLTFKSNLSQAVKQFLRQ
jgi:adenylate kinase family enzyme